jgi:quercetin dioxygenase-like cupin family protein
MLKGEDPMITANLNELRLLEGWQEHDPTARTRVAFPLYAATGTRDCSVVYFEIEPGHRLATHTDSAEEIVLVLDGTVEVTVGAETTRADRGGLVLIPEMVPHSVRNVGAETARCLGFFAKAAVESTFDQPLLPLGQRAAGAPPAAMLQGMALPTTWNQVAAGLMQMLGGPR